MKKFLVCILSIVVACSMLICFNGCKKDSSDPNDQQMEVNSLFLNRGKVELDISKTFDLDIAMTDASDTSGLKFTSSNESIATVDENGVITAVSVGTTTIVATLGNKSTTCEVVVYDSQPAAEIRYNGGDSITLDVGDTFDLEACVMSRGEKVSASLEFLSSDPNVAQVSNEGVITAVAAGMITITISGEYDGIPMSVVITVSVVPSTWLN